MQACSGSWKERKRGERVDDCGSMPPLVPRVEVMSRELNTESVAIRRYIIQNQIEHDESYDGDAAECSIDSFFLLFNR